jgi:hypothetical protein
MISGIGQGIVIHPTVDTSTQLVADFFPRPPLTSAGQLLHFALDAFQAVAGNTDTDPACSSIEAKAQELSLGR